MTQEVKLSEKEQEWYDLFKNYLKAERRMSAISWHLRLETGEKTATINYWLTKLVNKGLLKKETNCYCTKYTLIN